MVKFGGWTGLITAALAWYTCAALVINDTAGKTVLPLG
jgi:succinate-acetate transporter protein